MKSSPFTVHIVPTKQTIALSVRNAAGKIVQADALMTASLPEKQKTVLQRFAACVQAREQRFSGQEPLYLEGPHSHAELLLLDDLARLQKDTPKFLTGMHLQTAPFPVRIALAKDNPLALTLVLSVENEDIFASSAAVRIFGSTKTWVCVHLAGRYLLAPLNLDTPEVLQELSRRCNTAIPRSHLKTLLADMFHDAGSLGWIYLPATARVQTLAAVLQPRLYVKDEHPEVSFLLRFSYANHETLPTDDTHVYVYTTNTIFCIARNTRNEQNILRLLDESGLVCVNKEKGVYTTPQPLSWLAEDCRTVLSQGVELYGREALLGATLVEDRPRLRVHASANADWLDLKVSVQYADTHVPVQHLVDSLLNKDRFVRLADGRLGVIPSRWLERFSDVIGVVRVEKDVLRIAPTQQSIADAILDESLDQEVTFDLRSRREALVLVGNPPVVSVPMRFRATLRPYQQHGFSWLVALRKAGLGGILADDMGLGKTVQALCFLCSVHEQPQQKSLVVVPTSLLHNWRAEAAQFAPHLRVILHHGPSRDIKHWEHADIIITTYNTLRNDIADFLTKTFSVVLLDESQQIKNASSQVSKAVRQLSAQTRIAMTGTPIENSTLELFSQMAFVNPGLLGTLKQFSSAYARRIDERKDVSRSAGLRQLVRPFILRRTKDSVAKDLPPKQIITVRCDMAEEQRALYDALHKHVRDEVTDLLESATQQGVQVKILQAILRLRQIANHPRLLDEHYVGNSGKMDALLEAVLDVVSGNHKALIFSTFLGILDFLELTLRKKGVGIVRLDGSTADRQAVVEQFQHDPAITVFLISLKAGGVGLTLTAAEYVFLADPWWNPAIEAQAIDRAHRIGQTKPVFVYRMISEGTIEEKIVLLQEKKRAVADAIISAEDGIAKSLSREDIEALLE